MKQKVLLSIQGRQIYDDQEPDTIELVTEGTMEFRDGGLEPQRKAEFANGVPAGNDPSVAVSDGVWYADDQRESYQSVLRHYARGRRDRSGL